MPSNLLGFTILAVAWLDLGAGATAEERTLTLTEDQIRQLIRQVAEKDQENDKKQRDYTYVERDQEHTLDGKGHVKSTETKTYEVMDLYGDQVQRLSAKDDKPLSDKDARKEEKKIQHFMEKRRNESEKDRAKRQEKELKDREEGRKFMGEVADAFNFRLEGTEQVDGRETYVISAEPRPGYRPHSRETGFLPKVRFRAWIDKDELLVEEGRHSIHRYGVVWPDSGTPAQGLAGSHRAGARQRRGLAPSAR